MLTWYGLGKRPSRQKSLRLLLIALVVSKVIDPLDKLLTLIYEFPFEFEHASGSFQ